MENVILNLRNELIRSISAIDAWFDMDRTLLSQKINATDTVAEYLYNLTLSSRDLLDAITHRPQRNLGGPLDLQFPHDTLEDAAWKKGIGRIDLGSARAELREQLDRCLIYLELLLHRQSNVKRALLEEDVENFGGYQGVYLLLIHLKRYLGDLNQLGERNKDNASYR
ncbi:MAG: hypothetical protein QM762_06065 [Chryseolinea sp.]